MHPLVVETESKVIRAEAAAEAAGRLKGKGFDPDLICVHPGWGEALFLRTVWPDAPMLSYQEFFYQEHGFDTNFDAEFELERDLQGKSKLIMKNA